MPTSSPPHAISFAQFSAPFPSGEIVPILVFVPSSSAAGPSSPPVTPSLIPSQSIPQATQTTTSSVPLNISPSLIPSQSIPQANQAIISSVPLNVTNALPELIKEKATSVVYSQTQVEPIIQRGLSPPITAAEMVAAMDLRECRVDCSNVSLENSLSILNLDPEFAHLDFTNARVGIGNVEEATNSSLEFYTQPTLDNLAEQMEGEWHVQQNRKKKRQQQELKASGEANFTFSAGTGQRKAKAKATPP